MFKITFATENYRPDLQVTIRCNQIGDWQEDIAGNYTEGEWEFVLDESADPNFQFKFVLERQRWMNGANIQIAPQDGALFHYDDNQVYFQPIAEAIVENGSVAQLFFKPNFDENELYDLIVVGSGVGGGVLADQASDLGLKTLVLELGSYLFPTHIGNLPRQHKLAFQVDKHLWGLWDEFKTTNYINQPNSFYNGGQGFCLGGRSVFWGGFIPRMSWWEMDMWPQQVRWQLENIGYEKAEQLLKKSVAASPYQSSVLGFFSQQFQDYNCVSAPMAVGNTNTNTSSVATGVFSTAGLLMESRLTDGPKGNQNLTVNLNQAVTKLHTQNDTITQVEVDDLLSQQKRFYKARQYALCAGTLESAKLAMLSGLNNPNGLLGKGLTDHPIYFTHFSLPNTSPLFVGNSSAKILLRHKNANGQQHRFNILLELGADFNQNRHLDPDILDQMQAVKGNNMLCEIVFLFNTALQENNGLQQNGPSYVKPVVNMVDAPISGAEWDEINTIKTAVLNAIQGQALPNSNLDLQKAGLGGVAHEVGTLRMAANGQGVVDEQLKYNGYNNLYVCDLSVFPSSPAANPTLTLAALALGLSDHLKSVVG